MLLCSLPLPRFEAYTQKEPKAIITQKKIHQKGHWWALGSKADFPDLSKKIIVLQKPRERKVFPKSFYLHLTYQKLSLGFQSTSNPNRKYCVMTQFMCMYNIQYMYVFAEIKTFI